MLHLENLVMPRPPPRWQHVSFKPLLDWSSRHKTPHTTGVGSVACKLYHKSMRWATGNEKSGSRGLPRAAIAWAGFYVLCALLPSSLGFPVRSARRGFRCDRNATYFWGNRVLGFLGKAEL